MKRALITGITGQDGSYLAELLLKKGYAVSGTIRSTSNHKNIAAIEARLELIEGNLLDENFVRALVGRKFDEIYNLAAESAIYSGARTAEEFERVAALPPELFLRTIKDSPHTRFFQASSSEIFGDTNESPQNEQTSCHPRNPYGRGKLAAHQAVEAYRKNGLFAVSGILFNHESPRRDPYFVPRKITSTLARIAHGSQEILELGNLESMRDWSFAGDIVRGMWLSLQHEKPDSYIFASGIAHKVKDLVAAAAEAFEMPLTWKGEGLDEKAYDQKGNLVVQVNSNFYRPAEQFPLVGDITKARHELHWEPEIAFVELIKMMALAEV